MQARIEKAAKKIINSHHCVVFTGAGISVESGIPPFRGEGGLWNKYDPEILELAFFKKNTEESWEVIKKIFYEFFGKAKPNNAHKIISEWERKGIVKTVITQNIDNLHTEAGSENVLEFHGTSGAFICMDCGKKYETNAIEIAGAIPICEVCKGKLKPDFIFFGEQIPEPAGSLSFEEAKKADVFIITGTTGEVIPASWIPNEAKRNKALIIEINTKPSLYTGKITDIFLDGKAGEVFSEINEIITKQ